MRRSAEQLLIDPELVQDLRENIVARSVADLHLVDKVLAHDVSSGARRIIPPENGRDGLHPTRDFALLPINNDHSDQTFDYGGFTVVETHETGGARNLLSYKRGPEPQIKLIYQEFAIGTRTVDMSTDDEEMSLKAIAQGDYYTSLFRSRTFAAWCLLSTTPEKMAANKAAAHKDRFKLFKGLL